MEVVVLDSGMGGLDVAARLYERLEQQQLGASIRFVDIRPPPGSRYEEGRADEQKLALLDQTLRAVEGALPMDLMALACHSFASLIHRTAFHARHGPRLVLLDALGGDHGGPIGDAEIFVFGTELTIRGGAHRRALLDRGVRADQIVEQACPGLANSIQDGHASEQTATLLSTYVTEALARRRRPSAAEAVVLLACSHYGYLRERFRDAFLARSFCSVRLLCANESMVDAVVRRIERGGGEMARGGPSISLHTVHPPTAAERDNFIELLTPISPTTAACLNGIAVLGRAGA